ncbi:hypothetical protein Tco_0816344, partial [Tanacetum coccineum]
MQDLTRYSWTLGIDWVNVVAKDGSEGIWQTPKTVVVKELKLNHLIRATDPYFMVIGPEKGNGHDHYGKCALSIMEAVTIDSFACEALGTLFLAYIDLESGVSAETPIPSSGYTCIGILGSKDNVRPGVKESLALFRSTDDGIAINGADFPEKSLEVLLIIIPKIQVPASCNFLLIPPKTLMLEDENRCTL